MAAAIVQEYDAAPGLNPAQPAPEPFGLSLDQAIGRAALENGIERPRTHNVSFHYNAAVEQHHFGRSHPMKPWRLQLTKQLILSYGLQYAMDCYSTRVATKAEMAEFHKEEYLEFLQQINPDNMANQAASMAQFNFGDDCPVFDGLYEYCSLYTGATLSATRNLMAQSGSPGSHTSTKDPQAADIAINWSGGLHHALKSQASGFCYINDIVLAILVLLTRHPRVLYIDIDVHHGDGVEHAFASSDRVLTLSLHKYDPFEFFPGTGGPNASGPENPHNPGSKHSVNLPLKDGIDDDQYEQLFDTVVTEAVEMFHPTAIVLQCGGDSLGGDRLGKFNLNIRAHGHCVETCRSFQLPLLILGGGGYTARNVARLWTHETALCTDCELADGLPEHVPYRQAFMGAENGDGLLYPNLSHVEGKRHANQHDRKYLEDNIRRVKEQLRYLRGAPSVQMKQMPRSMWTLREKLEEQLKDEEEQAETPDGRSNKVRKSKEQNIGGRGELL